MNDQTMITVLVLLVIGMGCLFYLKWRYRKQAGNGALCLIRNKAGRWGFEVKEILGGFIEFPPPKEGGLGRLHAIDSESAPDIDFPINKWSFLQTTIPMGVYWEPNLDPISNVSGRPLVSASLMSVIRGEAVTANVMRFIREDERREVAAEAPKKKGISLGMVLAILAGLAVLGGVYWLWQQNQELKAAAGIGMNPIDIFRVWLGV